MFGWRSRHAEHRTGVARELTDGNLRGPQVLRFSGSRQEGALTGWPPPVAFTMLRSHGAVPLIVQQARCQENNILPIRSRRVGVPIRLRVHPQRNHSLLRPSTRLVGEALIRWRRGPDGLSERVAPPWPIQESFLR